MKEFSGSEKLKTFLGTLCKCLYACFQKGSKFLLPSHLRCAFLRNVSQLMVNNEVKGQLRLELIAALEITDETIDLNFFLISFVRKFSNKILAFILHWMVHDDSSPIKQCEYAITKQSTDSKEYKELMHFIGGANIKSVLRCAWRNWGSNDDCKSVIKTVRANFLVSSSDDVNSADEIFMEWTAAQDRGKLLKINSKALQFFIVLGSIVKPLEHFDGSLILNEVVDKISEHPQILLMWEELIAETLSKKVSFKLLYSLVEYFCNTWRSGIVRRRMDEIQGVVTAEPLGTKGIAFRPKVVKFDASK